jgi:hypothetical protein
MDESEARINSEEVEAKLAEYKKESMRWAQLSGEYAADLHKLENGFIWLAIMYIFLLGFLWGSTLARDE